VSSLLAPDASLERLYTGTEWGEGPVWLSGLRALRWSDIPNNRIMQYHADTGQTVVYREDVEFTNGRTLDRGGAVIQCSHGRRGVEREIGGQPVVLVDRWQGSRLNSPNDVVVASDGSIWFTDPPYGIISNREGRIADAEYGGCYVFRFDEQRAELTPMVTDMVHPNGLAFAPDERILYVSDSAWVRDKSAPRHIRAYDVVDTRPSASPADPRDPHRSTPGNPAASASELRESPSREGPEGAFRPGDTTAGTAAGGGLVCTLRENPLFEIDEGWPDGLRVDEAGRVWSSSGDGVRVFAPDGELVLHVPVPERVGNLCFGGPDGHDLYIAATSSLYRIRTATRDAVRRTAP
jgi:gluconolactonase